MSHAGHRTLTSALNWCYAVFRAGPGIGGRCVDRPERDEAQPEDDHDADDAEAPATWECRLHGSISRLVDGSEPEQKKAKPPRTHWDMLLERRSVADLEVLLTERLELLAERRADIA